MHVPWQKILPNGGRLFLGGGASVPYHLVDQLLAEANSFEDVEWMHIHTLGALPWIEPRFRGHFRTNTFFLTRSMWDAVNEGFADYTPSAMSDVPRLFDQGIIKLDVALIQVSPPDSNGQVSLGVSTDVLCSAIRNARTVVAQVNRHLPKTHGDSVISIDAIDHFVEHDAPLMTMSPTPYSERNRKIAEYAAQLIEDGSTIQASLGDCPQTVLQALKNHRNLGIHTGCFTDSMMELLESGVVTNERKKFQPGVSVATHCLGSQALYDFVSENPEIEMHASEWANDPHRISQHPNMVAINGAREVDLTGQVVRDSRGHRFYGGIGATQDFIRGSAGSAGGRPIIVLTSTRSRGEASRIVTGLSSGSGVSTSRGDVHYVVTEFGVANLIGQSIRQRVLRLVEIAHPRFQETLLEGARSQGWIPKTFGATTGNIRTDNAEIEIKKVDFSGIRYVVRPLHASDMRALQEFFYAQDEETIRLRYGYAMPKLDEQTAYRMASVDQSHDLALGVFYRSHLREDLRAVGRFYVDDGEDTAEVAFLVHENARRKGIAQYLLHEMAKIAQERGIQQFWASVLKRNAPMARLFTTLGARRKRIVGEDSDEFWMDIADLLESPPTLPEESSLGIYASDELLKHDTGDHHPESIARYQAVLDAVESLAWARRIPERVANVEDVLRVHSASYHDLVKIDIDEFRDCLRTGDTAVSEASYDVAMQALGGVLEAGDEVMSGLLKRAFCAVRPPGHHATEDRGMGFCIFNHTAILAKYLQEIHGVQRIAILDWDVHHGNGTQDIFYDTVEVLYVSSHQEEIFPFSGQSSETGNGAATGSTLNFPLPSGTDDHTLIETWKTALESVEAFAPEFLILSAGFDAASEDPMADFHISVEGFATLTRMVRDLADRICEGRIVSVLEGGYDPPTLAACVIRHAEVLDGRG